ncbi:SBBP repeat-containing protein [Nannocystis sp. SCPEA4]|uniref:SBBP repeat-containing protein n=1 Tax=Nannocystis sp. SCPEA4 TaxID=2996787 RepID=UPI00226F7C05|nr:SBBP repeat-containing protein [Nannocystis sp. SCPEA4]MCY1055079.1 SBBP repeat-containing protein [Nannocystis sp. SCPEA4]
MMTRVFWMFGSVAVAMVGVVGDASALPDREWGTYYGGTGSESAEDVAFDSWNYMVVAGYTTSTTGMTTSGAFDTVFNGAIDGFVSLWDQTSGRIWSTYYGGPGEDYFRKVVVNGDDEIYAVGSTKSSSGIATTGAHQTALSGTVDVMLVKLDDAGDPLWATYFGGPGDEESANPDQSVCVGSDGSVYIVGSTTSTSQIATAGAHQTSRRGTTDAYIAKFSGDGDLEWATYYGGTDGQTFATGCAVDSFRNVLVGGFTWATNGIASGGHDNTYNGGASDGFVVKFNASGVRQWATYYGGSNYDQIFDVALAPSDNLVVAGVTESTNFIASSGAHDISHNGDGDGFIAKFNASGVRQWGTFFGSSGYESLYSVDVSSAGTIYLAGTGAGAGLATSGAWDSTVGGSDGLFASFSAAGALLYASYNGGTAWDGAYGVASNSSGVAAVVGGTASSANVTTTGAFDTVLTGSYDALITLVRLYFV